MNIAFEDKDIITITNRESHQITLDVEYPNLKDSVSFVLQPGSYIIIRKKQHG